MIPNRLRLVAHLTLSALVAPLSAQAGISSFPQNPGFGEPTYSQVELDIAVAQAKANGRLESAAECLADPGNCGCSDGLSPCGVSTASTLPNALYGETEPNDHIVAADPLVSNAKYWGQSQSLTDQDWFYVTTNEPNQVLTLNFTVPDRVLTSTDRLSQGWLISVKDAAGNDYAQFDTRFALDDPNTTDKNESKEITYPVFLGHQGTYYVVIEPQLADASGVPITTPAGVNLNDLSILYTPYNLLAILDFSQLDNAPPDVNFHDVEAEPNDSDAQANVLTTGVTLYGSLLLTRDPTNVQVPNGIPIPQYLQTDQDWFKYHSEGNEQVVLTWCGVEDCEKGTWFVEVRKNGSTGTRLISANVTETGKTLNFGLKDKGDYFLHVDFKRDVNANCLEYQGGDNPTFPDDFKCSTLSYECQVLSVTQGDSVADPPTPNTCSYSTGNICDTNREQSETLVNCNQSWEVDQPQHPTWYWQEICNNFERICSRYDETQDLTDTISASYNFTWWGTRLPALTNGTPALDSFQEGPAFFQSR